MTIATCYVSPEGIVMGADSTTTVQIPGNPHYFNHAQKLFEIGTNSTLAAVTWGLGGLAVSSHRLLLAKLGDDLKANPAATVEEVAKRWIGLFWAEYQTAPFAPLLQRARDLAAKTAHDANAASTPQMRTAAEEQELGGLDGLIAGFCIGGYLLPDREPMAYEMVFKPQEPNPPIPVKLAMHNARFWGAPNMILRLIHGCDDGLKKSILGSPHWTGTPHDLDALVQQHALGHAILPIRDIVDFVHSCISSTIKALKFSNLSQICGGPIELAVITADREFRWVRHKSWDAAINEGEP